MININRNISDKQQYLKRSNCELTNDVYKVELLVLDRNTCNHLCWNKWLSKIEILVLYSNT